MNPQMRMVIMLGVTWAAGSWLLAAESPSTRAPAPAAQTPPAAGAPAETPAAKPAAEPEEPAPAAEKAGDDPRADAAKPPEESKPASGEPADDSEAAPPPPPPSSGGASPQRFVPSEQVRADFDVSFPIDI
jgi:hypothetical protein